MNIETFTAAGFEQNAYIAWHEQGRSAVAIDPGGAVADMIRFLETRKLKLNAILLTHAHIDHIQGVASLVRHTGARTYLHPDDRPFYDNGPLQAIQFGMTMEPPPPVDERLAHGQRLTFGELAFEVRHVPGHSPGHVLLYAESAGAAFVGDVVFSGSIGRTDLPAGNFQVLMRSIREQVLTLPETTKLYSGHGPPTTVATERDHNPFIAPQFGGGLA